MCKNLKRGFVATDMMNKPSMFCVDAPSCSGLNFMHANKIELGEMTNVVRDFRNKYKQAPLVAPTSLFTEVSSLVFCIMV